MKARRGRQTAWTAIGATLVFLAVGCEREAGSKAESAVPDTTPQAADPGSQAGDPRFHQSFADATRAEPPDDWQPVEQTMTGKSVGKLYEDVKRRWDTIRLTGSDGKPLSLSAVLVTDLGPVEVSLRPDLAPNHVRNFIALAQTGFYDGLPFHYIVAQEADDKKVQLVEGGCPLGSGDSRVGSLGYWLKPEFSAEPLHDVGAVGASHYEEADTAACKFYIMLNKAPHLDGVYTVFGRVTKGLDVVRKIYTQPVVETDASPAGYQRPVKPVVITKVTIHGLPG